MEEELAHHWVQLCGRTGHENREENEGHRLLEGNGSHCSVLRCSPSHGPLLQSMW